MKNYRDRNGRCIAILFRSIGVRPELVEKLRDAVKGHMVVSGALQATCTYKIREASHKTMPRIIARIVSKLRKAASKIGKASKNGAMHAGTRMQDQMHNELHNMFFSGLTASLSYFVWAEPPCFEGAKLGAR